MREHLTEPDVLVANKAFLGSMARKHGKRIHPEDCDRITEQAFLIAMRTYRQGHVAFHSYAEQVIGQSLQEERRHNDRICAIESTLSMDMRRGERQDGEPVCSFLDRKSSENFVKVVFLRDFLAQLPQAEQQVATMLIDRYTAPEILLFTGMRPPDLDGILENLRILWRRDEE